MTPLERTRLDHGFDYQFAANQSESDYLIHNDSLNWVVVTAPNKNQIYLQRFAMQDGSVASAKRLLSQVQSDTAYSYTLVRILATAEDYCVLFGLDSDSSRDLYVRCVQMNSNEATEQKMILPNISKSAVVRCQNVLNTSKLYCIHIRASNASENSTFTVDEAIVDTRGTSDDSPSFQKLYEGEDGEGIDVFVTKDAYGCFITKADLKVYGFQISGTNEFLPVIEIDEAKRYGFVSAFTYTSGYFGFFVYSQNSDLDYDFSYVLLKNNGSMARNLTKLWTSGSLAKPFVNYDGSIYVLIKQYQSHSLDVGLLSGPNTSYRPAPVGGLSFFEKHVYSKIQKDIDLWNGSFPVDGSNLVVPYHWNLTIDVSLPSLQQLKIIGSVSILPGENSPSPLVLKADQIVVEGSFDAIDLTVPLRIELTKSYKPDPLEIKGISYTSESLVVTGKFTIKRSVFYDQYTNLSETALSSAHSLDVEDIDYWPTNSEIVVAPFYKNPLNYEVHSIKKINEFGRKIILNEPLKNDYFGYSGVRKNSFLIATEVVLLADFITIEAANQGNAIFADLCAGCIRLVNARFNKIDVTFDNVVGTEDSLMQSTSITNSLNYNLCIKNSVNVSITNSVLFRANQNNLLIAERNDNLNISGNFLLSSGLNELSFDLQAANLRIESRIAVIGSTINSNRLVGSTGFNAVIPPVYESYESACSFYKAKKNSFL